MVKKLLGATALSFVLLFGVFAQSEGEASIAETGETGNQVEHNQLYNDIFIQSYFNNCHIVWKNGQLVVEEKQENHEVNKEDEVSNKDTDQTEQEVNKEENSRVEQKPEVTTENDSLNEFERGVFELTNQERAKHGLAPLQVDEPLSKVAREKSRDMAQNRYFDHNSPVHGSPFDMMRANGITYRTAGENIAKGQQTPEAVVQAWMDSPGHRANILNDSFTHIGIGYVEQGNHWTQQFIAK